MTDSSIEFRVDGPIARLTLNRPDSLNSFTVDMHREVAEALRRVRKSETARCLILTGAGRGFCAGQDLKERRVSADGPPPDLSASLDQRYNPLIRSLRDLPIPVIAAVNGVAAGAGVGIALACDIVVAARSARFALVFNKLGLIPDAGTTWSLPRLAGQGRALAAVLTSDTVSAERAEAWGLIWRCVDDEALADEVEAIASRLSAQPRLGMALTKRAFNRSLGNSLDGQLDLERDCQGMTGRDPEYRERVRAFLEKR
ncbi:2-(1,2-epoxy-1,2-dihydrophenyl)acetyl-CoA isomerase PaaG [Rhodospirillum sp. A1_3_36]|uniref:2-(1,2-epoxy-1,2-dihydrophenyl)acetyl-CoA isomerase PaaG n=1 Tax=Rhodospirillum sp. A1_3_36 TaxID=3391666 RepID=UPI0039A69838